MTTHRAPCTAAPDLFWSNAPADERAARALCSGCPLRPACAAHALDNDEPLGTWGGLTATDRVQMRLGPGWWIDTADRERHPCGTVEALGQHYRYDQPCPDCLAAAAARVEEQRRQLLAVEHALPAGGSVRGYDTHRRMGEDACPPCLAAKAGASATKRERAARRLAAAPGPPAAAALVGSAAA